MLPKSLVCCVLILMVVVAASRQAGADLAVLSAWTGSGPATVRKVLQLPADIELKSGNNDCAPVALNQFLGADARVDCVITAPYGQIGPNGVLFEGTNEQIPVVPPRIFVGLNGIPSQPMTYTYTSSGYLGNYMHFYRSIRSKIPLLPRLVSGSWQYVVDDNPDFSLRDGDGALLAMNPSILAFSGDGSWMITDIVNKGLVRVNLATFEIVPFAPSLQGRNDLSNQQAQLSISDDGNRIAVYSAYYHSFKVYDLAGCAVTKLPVSYEATPCPKRDYIDQLEAAIPNLAALYQPRFMSDDQIGFAAAYDRLGGHFKLASFTLTAPGSLPDGIQYLGMGDSYASGEGAYGYTASTDTAANQCHVSTKSYALLLSAQLFQSGYNVACSGAKTVDVVSHSAQYGGQTSPKIAWRGLPSTGLQAILFQHQPGVVPQRVYVMADKPQALTISIGGNDIGFADIIARCIQPALLSGDCYAHYEDRLELYRSIDRVRGRLADTYRQLYRPGERVYVIGYPQIIAPGGSCGLNVRFSKAEASFANDLVNYLDATIQAAATAAGVRYVDVSRAFAGHRLCEAGPSQSAANGLTAGNNIGVGILKFVGVESYHPTALGYELLAETIRQQTQNLTLAMPDSQPLTFSAAAALPDLSALPKSGRPVRELVIDSTMTADNVGRGQPLTIIQQSALKPQAVYDLVLAGTRLGSATADSEGQLTTTLAVPSTAPPGYQSLDIVGINQLGEPLDVSKTVYVTASPADSDTDGLADSEDSCPYILNSAIDADRDGIDDACDPDVSVSPAYDGAVYRAYLTANTIHIGL